MKKLMSLALALSAVSLGERAFAQPSFEEQLSSDMPDIRVEGAAAAPERVQEFLPAPGDLPESFVPAEKVVAMECFGLLVPEFGPAAAAESCRGTDMKCFNALSGKLALDAAAQSCRASGAARSPGVGAGKAASEAAAVSRSVDFNKETYDWDEHGMGWLSCADTGKTFTYANEEWWREKKEGYEEYICEYKLTFSGSWRNCTEPYPHTSPGQCYCKVSVRQTDKVKTGRCQWQTIGQ